MIISPKKKTHCCVFSLVRLSEKSPLARDHVTDMKHRLKSGKGIMDIDGTAGNRAFARIWPWDIWKVKIGIR
jgi:hypothetical protein